MVDDQEQFVGEDFVPPIEDAPEDVIPQLAQTDESVQEQDAEQVEDIIPILPELSVPEPEEFAVEIPEPVYPGGPLDSYEGFLGGTLEFSNVGSGFIASADEAEEIATGADEYRALGTAKIVTNATGGAYTITRIIWNGSAYVADTEGAYYQVSARDYRNRDYAVASTEPIRFWEVTKSDGSTEILIDISGTSGTVKALYATFEGSETAQSDTWDRENPDSGKDGVTIPVTTRVVYNHAGDKKVYGFYRTFTYDSTGMLKAISAETRYEVDAAGACS
jgi:hypothetical protein